MAAHAISFCSNLWSSSSTSSLQQQQQQPNQYLNPNQVTFQHRKRPRSSISPSNSLSFSNNYPNPNSIITNANHSPFTPLQSNNNPFLFSHQNNNNWYSNHQLFPTDIYGTTTFFDPPSPQTLIPLDQDDYYHQNSLDFLDNSNDPILDFSSPEDQILLAPLLADPLPSCIADQQQQYHHHEYLDDHHDHRPKKQPNTVVSPQSIAARERRRKITERTSDLGKLIPGGNKMSTAEMFQAAHKYVKFLQAQVSLLQLLNSSNQGMKEEDHVYVKELQVLSSPIVQEKLYSEEKCLAPKEFIDRILATNQRPSLNSV